MNIPFVDLKSQYESISEEIDTAIKNVIKDTAFIKGKYLEDFEEQFKEFYGVEHCIGVANGTDALYISMKAMGIGIGDEVITTSHSWISTSETITQTGAKPVFVDTEIDYYTMNPDLVEEKITDKTKAIIPVHLYGQPANIVKIQKLSERYGLRLIEDCAQSHFAEFQSKKVGTFGDVGTFSFFPGKNLGAYGDAGAIITNNKNLSKKIRMYANHGSLVKHEHQIEGVNSRLDGLQAAILSVKLPYINEWNQRRLENAKYYSQLLSDVDSVEIPKIREGVRHVFHLYVIRTKRRADLVSKMRRNNIEVAIHYPCILPLLPAYNYLGHKVADFPVSSSYQDEILSLPLYPEISEKQMDFVVKTIKEVI